MRKKIKRLSPLSIVLTMKSELFYLGSEYKICMTIQVIILQIFLQHISQNYS